MYRVRLAQGITNYRANKAAITLSNVFTSENSVNALVKLAKNKTDMRSVNVIALALTPARLKSTKSKFTRRCYIKRRFFGIQSNTTRKNKKQINIDPKVKKNLNLG